MLYFGTLLFWDLKKKHKSTILIFLKKETSVLALKYALKQCFSNVVRKLPTTELTKIFVSFTLIYFPKNFIGLTISKWGTL